MQVVLQKLPKSGVKLTITIEAEAVKESYQKVLAEVVKNTQIDGFRKGNAPADLVKAKIDPAKMSNQVITELVTTYYPKALEEQKLQPIISPKVEVNDFDPEKAFTFSAETAVKPQVTVGDYKKAIKDVFDKKKAEADKLPKAKDSKKDASNEPHLSPNDVVSAILSVTTVEIPDMIIEEEVNKMLSRLVSQIQPLSLSMEDYLKSVNKSGDDLRKEYGEIAQRSISGEIALVEVVAKENVKVDDSEVDAAIEAAGDAKIKERYDKNPLEKAYVRAIIAKNKLLWNLIAEIETGEKAPEEDLDKKEVKDDDTKK